MEKVSRRRFVQFATSGITVVGVAGASLEFLSARQVRALQPPAGPAGPENTVAGMAAALGYDLKRIYTFVQEEIRYEPYAGVLRGARGTLLARAGNSVDQAVLLAELLRASSLSARFVSGPIDASAADALMSLTITDTEVSRRQVDQAVISDDDSKEGVQWLPPKGSNFSERRARFPKPDSLRAAFASDVNDHSKLAAEQLRDAVRTILDALTAARINVPGDLTRLPGLEQTAHTWVQAQDGSGWLDLDPSFRDLEPGKTRGVPGAPVDALGDAVRHRVTFTVFAESLAGGRLTEARLLTVSAFSDELAYANVIFTHIAPDRLPGIGLFGGGGGETKRYHPVLVIGNTRYIARKPIVIGGGDGGGTFADALSGADEGGLVEGETSAEWLEVRVTSPGAGAAPARREIFDRVGLDRRRRGAIQPNAVPKAAMVDLGDGSGRQYLPCRSIRAFLISGAIVNLRAFVEGLGPDDPPGLSLLPAGYDGLRHLFGVALAKQTGCRSFNDSPGVASWVLDATPDGFVHGLDIWHRSFATIGLSGSVPVAPPAMIAGVMAHVVERIAMGDVVPLAVAPDKPLTSVGGIFEKAASEKIGTRLFVRSLPVDNPYEPEHRARIQKALDAGLLVVAPAEPVVQRGRRRLGWWLIDPATGSATDEMDDGRGETGDYVVVNEAGGALSETAISEYGWGVLNQGIKYVGPNQKAVAHATSRLWEALMAMRPPPIP